MTMRTERLIQHLNTLGLPYIREHYQALADQALADHWPPLQLIEALIEGEFQAKESRRVDRLVRDAHFPMIKTLDAFDWNWPKKINRPQIQNLFRLDFIKTHTNVVFLGGVGIGKSHLALALGHTACLRGYTVLFTTAIDIINTLSAAQTNHTLKRELKKYVKPSLLLIDELGYLPVTKQGADLLFQVISQRYERGATVITTNRAFKLWSEIFNNDSTLTSALLDRLMHHVDTVILQGKSYRTKDQIEAE
jgi:DNA replication protein DnaC